MNLELLKKPTAWIPLALATGALTVPYLWVLVIGADPAGDEGGAAHLWQILMAAQFLAIFFFALTQLPQKPKLGLITLAVQIIAFLVAAAPVFLLKL